MNVDKKNIIIFILTLIIILLVLFIIRGNNNFERVSESLRSERNSAVRSAGIISSELKRSRGETQKLEAEYFELEQIIGDLTAGSKKTEYHLNEYGNINRDFREFLQQNSEVE